MLYVDRIRSVLPGDDLTLLFAAFVLIAGIVLGYLVGQFNERFLRGVGLDEVVEGTPFERTARGLNTSTVELVARLSSWFVYGVTVVVVLQITNIVDASQLWAQVPAFIPHLFVAVLILIAGVVIGDKLELLVRDRVQAVKLPQVGIVPLAVKYSVIFLAALLALGQVGVTVNALLILLAGYLFAIVLFGALATRDLLSSAAAGIYLLLHEPYGIGDEICIEDRCGIVQEVDMFVTHIEAENREYVIPNRMVFRNGIVRVRDDG